MSAPVTPSLVFQVHRCKPELIAPATPTPRELKKLSDIDDQDSLRLHVDVVHFYRGNPKMRGRDPVGVIREALARALVFYYPLAGRLGEGPGRKLHVDCTGEGVLFVEADADVELKQLGDPPRPPFPCFEELLYPVQGCQEILNTPLFHFQVTRLKCNGFVVAVRLNHTITDGFGFTQFLKAVCELARGATAPSVSPVWKRHVLRARDEPRVTCTHPEYDENSIGFAYPFEDRDDVVDRSFFFGSSHVSAVRTLVPRRLRHSSDFDVLTACLWLCRVKALEVDPEEEVRLNFTVNARGSGFDPPLPAGYYGNAFVFPAAVTTAGALSFGHAIELVRETKIVVTKEYMQSTTDLLATRGRPCISTRNSFWVSDASQFGMDGIDYGWGKPLFGGAPGTDKGLLSFYLRFENEEGEIGRLFTCGLPARAMNNFVKELDYMVRYSERAKI